MKYKQTPEQQQAGRRIKLVFGTQARPMINNRWQQKPTKPMLRKYISLQVQEPGDADWGSINSFRINIGTDPGTVASYRQELLRKQYSWINGQYFSRGCKYRIAEVELLDAA